MLFCMLLMLHPVTPLTEQTVELRSMHFRGELLRRDSDGFSPIDDFDLIRFVDSTGRNRGHVMLQASADRNPWTGSVSPQLDARLRHVHDGVPYQLDLVALTIDRELKEGAIWTSGRQTFRVGGSAKLNDRTCTEVFVSGGPARRHKLLVDPKTGDVLSLTQRVFMGRGDEFRLTLHLASTTTDTNVATDAKFFSELLKIREASGVDTTKPTAALTTRQLGLVASALPGLKDLAKSRWSKTLLNRMESDTQAQKNRTLKLADMEKAALGKALVPFKGEAANGKTVDSAQFTGNAVVLHLWKYRDEPLTEPYGQTAYLNFMADKFAGQPVRVVGINIDSRYSDKTQVSKANRSVRKLVEFMNLDYDVVGNDGSILQKLGDPRAAGAELPLWIVLDKSGRIRMWKAGFYPVDVRHGLKDLQALVTDLLK